MENKKKKSAWITGASGMLGLALTKYLLQQDVEVTAVIRENSSKKAIFPEHENLRLVECNLEHLADYIPREGETCDWFFHFAWAGTTGADRNNMYLQNCNIRYTLDAVHLAKKLGAELFLGAGSQAEYGRVEGMLRGDTPAYPENGYGMAKLCAGEMTRVLCKELSMRHIWMRILSVYGPYNVENSMVISGIRKLLAGERPSYTKGEQLWDYLYVEDAAKAFYLAAVSGKDGAIYPLGSGQAVPLAEYIQKIRDAVDPHLEIGLGEVSYSENQVMHLQADISALTKDTGFLPEYSFEEGIRETVAYVKEHPLA